MYEISFINYLIDALCFFRLKLRLVFLQAVLDDHRCVVTPVHLPDGRLFVLERLIDLKEMRHLV